MTEGDVCVCGHTEVSHWMVRDMAGTVDALRRGGCSHSQKFSNQLWEACSCAAFTPAPKEQPKMCPTCQSGIAISSNHKCSEFWYGLDALEKAAARMDAALKETTMDTTPPATNTAPVKDEWLDAPDGDGWWWFRDISGELAPIFVKGNRGKDAFGLFSDDEPWAELDSGHYDYGKWSKLTPPPPPPVTLPRERQVRIDSARVWKSPTVGEWMVEWKIDGVVVCNRDTWPNRIDAENRARELGVEPHVEVGWSDE